MRMYYVHDTFLHGTTLCTHDTCSVYTSPGSSAGAHTLPRWLEGTL